jgi:arylsulfatase A-like enzyme
MRASANAAGARSYDDYDANGIREVIRAYRAMVSHVDFEIGKILEATNGLDRSTVTVFLSDHGEMLGDHGLLLKGPAMYEEAVKVPLIVSWPEHLPAKTSTEALVQQIDLAATLLDAADLLDEGPNFGQGTSLMPLARGERTQVRHWAITEYRDSGRPEVPPLNGTMYREGDKKLIVYHSLSTGGVRREYQLFDLAEDPNEVDDGSAKEPDEVAAEMMGTMLDRLVEVERREAPRLALW